MKANLKGKAKSVRLFFVGMLVGVVIGASTTYSARTHPYQNMAVNQYISHVIYDTDNARVLRLGNARGVNQRIEMTLPRYALTIDQQYRDHPMATTALQNIRRYYETNNIPIPTDIKPILNRVPK
jgi:hypothetical protein